MLTKARELGIGIIEETCYHQFEEEGYEQLRYLKYQLLDCPEEVFIDILRRHHHLKAVNEGFGLKEEAIEEIINDYALHKAMNKEQKESLLEILTQSFCHPD